MRWTVCALALLLASCGESFDPPSSVRGLRILAVQVDPPEVGAQDSEAPSLSRISTLVADPQQLDEPEREILVAHLSCTPDPKSAQPSLCTAIANLRDPTELGPELPSTLCEGGAGGPAEEGRSPIAFIGIERCDHVEGCGQATVEGEGIALPLPLPTYRFPADLGLDTLPPGHPGRLRGEQAVIFSLAIPATVADLIEGIDPEGDCFAGEIVGRFLELYEARNGIMALKRLQLRGPDQRDDPNVNPSVPGILASGVPLSAPPQPAAMTFERGERILLHPRLPAAGLDADGRPLPRGSVYQRFTRYRTDGEAVANETERWTYAWFATGGSVESQPRRGEATWIAPGDEEEGLHPSGRTFVYVVVRDGRGGTAWARAEVHVR